MATRHERATDPGQTVRRAIDERRGFVSQADITETTKAIQRLGGLGETPQEFQGPLNIQGDMTLTEGLLRVQVVNDSTGPLLDGLVVGPIYDELIGDYYTMSYSLESGLYVFKIKNGGGFPTLQITQEADGTSTLELREGSVLNLYDGAGALSGTIDAATGTVITETAEASSTTVAGATNTAPGNTTRRYDYFQLPTTEKWYIITGIEWKNGTTVNGNVWSGVDLVDADPPVGNDIVAVATGNPRAMSGSGVVQKVTRISSVPIRGGTRLGVWFQTDSATATFGNTTGLANENNRKTLAAGTLPAADNSAWAASTAHYYARAYYRGVR